MSPRNSYSRSCLSASLNQLVRIRGILPSPFPPSKDYFIFSPPIALLCMIINNQGFCLESGREMPACPVLHPSFFFFYFFLFLFYCHVVAMQSQQWEAQERQSQSHRQAAQGSAAVLLTPRSLRSPLPRRRPLRGTTRTTSPAAPAWACSRFAFLLFPTLVGSSQMARPSEHNTVTITFIATATTVLTEDAAERKAAVQSGRHAGLPRARSSPRQGPRYDRLITFSSRRS